MYYKRNEDGSITISKIRLDKEYKDTEKLLKKRDGTFYTFYNENGTPDLLKESEKNKNKLEKIEQVEELTNEDNDVDSCEIRQNLLDIKDVQIDHKKQHHDTSIEILKETHFIKKNLAQHNRTTYGLVFLTGAVFGMSEEKWTPYIKYVWDLFSNIIIK